MKIQNPIALKDGLHNLSRDSGASPEYCRGLVVGVFSALMATTGKTYAELVPYVREALPDNVLIDCIPDAFRNEFIGRCYSR